MRADSRETVDDLLNVAERLFARHGVEQVALTRIVGSSRQKNRSALHYHFGSREGVLKAVLDRRLKHINALRLETLDRPARCNDLARVIRALVEPLCLVALNEPWGADYISILAQVSFHPTLLGESVLDDANLSSVRRCKKLVIDAPADDPAGDAQSPLSLVDGQCCPRGGAMGPWRFEFGARARRDGEPGRGIHRVRCRRARCASG